MSKFGNTTDNFHPLKHPTWRLPPTHKSLHASGRVVGETSGNDDFIRKKYSEFFLFVLFLFMFFLFLFRTSRFLLLTKTFDKSGASAKDANFLTLSFLRKY